MLKRLCVIGLLLTIGLQGRSQSLLWDYTTQVATELIDSLSVGLPNTNGIERSRLLNNLAVAYWTVNPDVTIRYGSEALEIAKSERSREQEAYALLNLCQGYLLNDLYDKALDYGLQSLEIRRELGDPINTAFSLRTLGWLYFDIAYYDKALEYHQEVLEIHIKLNDNERVAYSYNSIGLIYMELQDFRTALSFFRKSLEMKMPFGNNLRIIETLKNIGICYGELEDYDQAFANLNRALDMMKDHRDDYSMAEALNEMAIIYINQNNYEAAGRTLERSRLIMEGLNDNKVLLSRFYQISSEYYAAIGDFERGLEYYRLYTEVVNDVHSTDKNQRLMEMRIFFEADRRESKIALLEQENQAEQFKQRVLLIGLALLVIIAVLVIGRLRSSARKKREIYEANQRLVRSELKNEELASSKLKDKLDYRMQELTNMALYIAHRTEVFNSLSTSLKHFDFMDRNDAKKKLQQLMKEFEQKLKINEDLDNFYSNVDNLNDDFIFRIKEQFPHLTENDLRLATQLRLNITSKEIALLNSISVKSVEISRYRLRKKLNLDSKDNLTEFLSNY